MVRSFEVDQQDINKSAEKQINQTGKREDILEDQIKRRDTVLGSWGKPAESPCWEKASGQPVQTVQTVGISINDARSCVQPTPENMSRLRPVADSLENVGFVSKGDKKCV
jgi:hypothetical protein